MLNEEALRQFTYLSSLMAGFGVMVTVGLLSLKDERRIVSWVIGIMVLASLLFLTSTSLAAMYFIVPSDWLSYMPSEVPRPEEMGFEFLDAVAITLAAFTYIVSSFKTGADKISAGVSKDHICSPLSLLIAYK